MSELLFIYSENTVFYAKEENNNPVIFLNYTADIGVQLVNFLEGEYTESPYSLLEGYEESSELRDYFKDFAIGLLNNELGLYDLGGKKIEPPMPIELLRHSDRFKKTFTVKHFIVPDEERGFVIRAAYVISSLYDALFIELIKLIESGKIVKACENCGKIFFPKNNIEKYCDRLVESGKTCKNIGYIYKVENDELLKAYNTAYKTKHAEKQRKTRGKSQDVIDKYNNALKIWREKARVELEKAQKKQIAKDEFLRFLKKRLEV